MPDMDYVIYHSKPNATHYHTSLHRTRLIVRPRKVQALTWAVEYSKSTTWAQIRWKRPKNLSAFRRLMYKVRWCPKQFMQIVTCKTALTKVTNKVLYNLNTGLNYTVTVAVIPLYQNYSMSQGRKIVYQMSGHWSPKAAVSFRTRNPFMNKNATSLSTFRDQWTPLTTAQYDEQSQSHSGSAHLCQKIQFVVNIINAPLYRWVPYVTATWRTWVTLK